MEGGREVEEEEEEVIKSCEVFESIGTGQQFSQRQSSKHHLIGVESFGEISSGSSSSRRESPCLACRSDHSPTHLARIRLIINVQTTRPVCLSALSRASTLSSLIGLHDTLGRLCRRRELSNKSF
jgi:hypothetical protein